MMAKEYKEIGRVVQIFRFPVKSMRGERIDEGKLGWHGLAGDRRFAFVRVANKSGLPWLSAREFPQMILYSARFSNSNDVENSPIVVTTPDGRDVMLESEELAAEISRAYGSEVRLMQLWRGTFDSMALSLISVASIQAISAQVSCGLEIERFRPNILVEAFEDKAYPEDRWIGEILVFGSENPARVHACRKDLRCAIVGLDPKTAQENPAVLKAIVSSRKNLLGIYGTTERPGTIRVGDIVRVLKA